MRSLPMFAILSMAVLLPSDALAVFGRKSPDERRAAIVESRDETLARLYAEKPATEEQIQESVGYAVFSNTGVNVLLVSTANGSGIAHDNASAQDTYMNMFSAGGGIGLGVKKFSAVFIFHTREAFDQFVDKGWNFTGQADAAATTDGATDEQAGSAGGTVGLSAGVSVYQMTDKGFALQATLQGTKYWKNEDLN